ncbi:MAG TPA: hypothetical protein VFQ61_19785, partial [Polyangiaceae bacterium]|nr:hypothetical protein [Polyangiaceae bacterium]
LECIRSTLVEEERELLVLRVDRNLAWEDIAIIMSTRAVPVSANGLVQRFSRLKRKLKRLREELPETCGRVDCANSEACARRRSLQVEVRST